jgi:hypothetical protein
MGHTVTKESRYYKVAPPEEESFIVGAGLTKIKPTNRSYRPRGCEKDAAGACTSVPIQRQVQKLISALEARN